MPLATRNVHEVGSSIMIFRQKVARRLPMANLDGVEHEIDAVQSVRLGECSSHKGGGCCKLWG